VITGLLGFAATVMTPLAPLLFGGAVLFAVLVLTRVLLGISQAPFFPLSTGVIETWFPTGRWAYANGLQVAGLHLGSAASAPLIAILMQTYGWKNALLWTSFPTLALVALWAWYGRNSPAEHGSVSAAELGELRANPVHPATHPVTLADLRRVLGNRDVLWLTLSYTAMNYVFYLLTSWCFLYLVQERHLSVLESGWLATLPFIAAGIGAGSGGMLSDWLAARFGPRIGYRAVPLVSLPLAGLLLVVGVESSSAYLAIAALSLAFAAVEVTEGAYGAAATAVAGEHTMAAFGVVNTGGNLGGVIGTPLVAWLSSQHAWTAAFLTRTAAAIVSGIMWLWIDSSRSLSAGQGMTVGH
jgi:MFS transporter, ACS family, glucarate transporter